jgi:hypothetical protein
MTGKLLSSAVVALVSFASFGPKPLSAQANSASAENKARAAKSARFNGGRCDLTIPGRDCFFEHFAPGAIPLIPLEQSDIAVLGRVAKVETYLSADRTHIYTETTIRLEEVFKSPAGFNFAPDRTIIADQIGGAMRMASGRIIYDRSVIDFLGKAYAGGQYVFFLRQVHEGRDLAILRAYELRDGKVFKLTEDGSPGKTILSKIQTSQIRFLMKGSSCRTSDSVKRRLQNNMRPN